MALQALQRYNPYKTVCYAHHQKNLVTPKMALQALQRRINKKIPPFTAGLFDYAYQFWQRFFNSFEC
ncbi:TPA: hypothetical protein HJP37_004596 [Escherichia coli]|nr:hypothetical protein [Escherichia coli]